MKTVSFKISPFIAFEASGSDISNPDAINSGYDLNLAHELARHPNGGTLHLTREGLLDLAEWLDCMESANGGAGAGNFSGARSCATHAERARDLADSVEWEVAR